MQHFSKFDPSQMHFKTHKIKNSDLSVAQIILAFDIETTSMFFKNGKWDVFHETNVIEDESYYKDCEKVSFCYLWQFGYMDFDNDNNPHINVFYGRYLEEFKGLLMSIIEYYPQTKFIIYVHNLSYEFQFLRNIFNDITVFARKERKPMKFDIFDSLIEFKCSLMLSNLSLEMLAEVYNLPVKKAVGSLDYNKPHFSDTKLTTDEIDYAERDILVMLYYLKIEYENVNRYLERIPLTSTSKVRKRLQKIYQKNYAYVKKMQSLVPTLPVFKQLMKTYMGATTHANPLWVGYHCQSLSCKDLTSSYPTVLISEPYPCSNFFKIKSDDFSKIDRSKYCYMCKISFYKIKSKKYMNYISYSKCKEPIGCRCDNGKIISADFLSMYITDADFDIINDVYNFESFEITDLYIAKKDYLDINFIRFILELYSEKTKLKGCKGDIAELQYLKLKELLNSLYGMCVTNLVSSEILFDNDGVGWSVDELTDDKMKKMLMKQRKSNKTLLQYSTGVWCTAYARRRLWLEGLLPLGRDCVYTDTDSVKFFNPQNYVNHFNKVNNDILCKLETACRGNEELIKMLYPKDNDGVVHPLGIWDDEGICDFKTWGAKKYISKKDGKLKVTVAGLNKKKALTNPKLKSIDDFSTGLKFNPSQSGRMTAYYLDDMKPVEIDGHVIDYKYGIVLQPTTYTLNITNDFEELLEEESLAYNQTIIDNYLKEK